MVYKRLSWPEENFAREKIDTWEYYHEPRLTARGFVHGFFTRNCPSLTNETEIRSFLDTFSLDRVVMLRQEHGDTIHTVRTGETPDAGDGLMVVTSGQAAVIKTADCLCIVLIDPVFPVAAIVHAGWRGTLRRITSKAIEMMVEHGASKECIVALIGPSIRGCCYTVGKDVEDAFLKEGFPVDIFRLRNDSLYLDLKEANARLLHDAGITTILDTGLCTYCSDDPLFFSYRKGARNERQINFVAIKKGVFPYL